MSGRDRPYVAVIGASQPTGDQEQLAEEVGRELGRAGAIVITGGGGGVMAAASRGADAEGATVIGLLPGETRDHANPWVGIALPTGVGELRNGLIVRACDGAIAVGGAYGTLSEIALAMVAKRPVVGLQSWDVRGVETVATPTEAVRRLLERLGRGDAPAPARDDA